MFIKSFVFINKTASQCGPMDKTERCVFKRERTSVDKALEFEELNASGVCVCVCSLLLDNERWKQAEVPVEFQDLVDSIADGRISLPERRHTGTKPPATIAIHYLISLINRFFYCTV